MVLKVSLELGKLLVIGLLGFVLGQQFTENEYQERNSFVSENPLDARPNLNAPKPMKMDEAIESNAIANGSMQSNSNDKENSIEHPDVIFKTQNVTAEQPQTDLYLDEFEFVQNNENLDGYEMDLIDPVYDMDEVEQKQYIKTLSENQDDESIEAINAMVFENDMTLRTEAVNELLEIMSHDTGHYDLIKQFLEENSAYMSNEQLQKMEVITEEIDERRTTFASTM